MGQTVLVTGGTGTLGRAVVARLLAAGADVRVASRGAQPAGTRPYAWRTVDYRTGAGLDAAVAGVDAIVHCATSYRAEVALARTVTEAARRAGCPHLVYISIVGVDRVPFFYYRGKLDAERVVRESGLPWTVQRATQFHDLLFSGIRALATSPIVPVPAGLRFQPVDVGTVADRLVEPVLGQPVGAAPDLGGPITQELTDLVRDYLRATRRSRPILPIPLPGRMVREVRAGALTAPDHRVGTVTFAEFLADQVPSIH